MIHLSIRLLISPSNYKLFDLPPEILCLLDIEDLPAITSLLTSEISWRSHLFKILNLLAITLLSTSETNQQSYLCQALNFPAKYISVILSILLSITILHSSSFPGTSIVSHISSILWILQSITILSACQIPRYIPCQSNFAQPFTSLAIASPSASRILRYIPCQSIRSQPFTSPDNCVPFCLSHLWNILSRSHFFFNSLFSWQSNLCRPLKFPDNNIPSISFSMHTSLLFPALSFIILHCCFSSISSSSFQPSFSGSVKNGSSALSCIRFWFCQLSIPSTFNCKP